MSNEEIEVVRNSELSLKAEASAITRQYATKCLREAEKPAKQLAFSAINRLLDYLITFINAA